MFETLTANERQNLMSHLSHAQQSCKTYGRFFWDIGRPGARVWDNMSTEMAALWWEASGSDPQRAADHCFTHDPPYWQGYHNVGR